MHPNKMSERMNDRMSDKYHVYFFVLFVCTYVVFLTICGVVLIPMNTGLSKSYDYFRKLDLLKTKTAESKSQNYKLDVMGNIPIYFINLDRSLTRHKSFSDSAQHVGIESLLHRVSAVNGQQITNVNGQQITNVDGQSLSNENMSFTSNFYKPNKSNLACALSHIKAIKQAYDDKQELALIMEDDASFDLLPLWNTTLPVLIRDLTVQHPSWQILSLFNHNQVGKHNPPVFLKNLMLQGAVAYIINRKGMETCIQTLFDKDQRNIVLDKHQFKYISADYLIFNASDNFYTYSDPLFFTSDPSSVRMNNMDVKYTVNITDRILNFYIKS